MHFDAQNTLVGIVVLFDLILRLRVEEEYLLNIIFNEPVDSIIYGAEVTYLKKRLNHT